MGLGAELLNQIVGIYIRLDPSEIERLRDNPSILPLYDPRVALSDGRGLDLGRAWEELGVFLDGGVTLPDRGPTVGDVPMPNTDDRATWSYIEPERVAEMAAMLSQYHKRELREHYDVDGEDTARLIDARTAGWGDRAQYMYNKLRALAKHFAAAAGRGEGMLVRIGERI